MNLNILLQKLIDIERSIGRETNRTILDKVLDAENCLLENQKEMIEGPDDESEQHKLPRATKLVAFPAALSEPPPRSAEDAPASVRLAVPMRNNNREIASGGN